MASGTVDDSYIGVWGLPVIPGWTTRVGLMGMLFPAYEGAKNYMLWPIPSFEVDYNDRLYADDTAATYAVFQNKWISVGPELTPYIGREESYSDALRGMGNLPFDLKGGGVVGLHSPVGSLVVECSRSITSSVGATGSINFQTGYVSDDKHFVLAVTPGITWADNDYMRNNFGISPSQSVRSGYAVYSPSAGFYNYWMNIAPTFVIHTRHYLIPSFTYMRLIDEARGSPLVTGPGTPNEFVGQLSYQYLF
jgi:outer membrane scaffolding protein for murein synthesis (MipA/OmpV family)